MDTPTHADIQKMAKRPAIAPMPKAENSYKPSSRGGRALYSALNDVARHTKSDRCKLLAAVLLGVLEGHWEARDVTPLVEKHIGAPILQPSAKSTGAFEEPLAVLKTDGGEKVQQYLPETGPQLVDLATQYGLDK